MSTKYPGGFITKSPVAPTTAAASGVWTLDQQQQYQKAGTWPAPPNYIEEVFSTYLYTGNGSTQTITNGIDLSTKGGLVWAKDRSVARSNQLHDSARGFDYRLISNTTDAQSLITTAITSVSTTGFSIGSNTNWNASGETYASWTFRKQPKFFDIVTYTGNGTTQTINHNLGSVPGCIIVKATNQVSGWATYHVSVGNNNALFLNLTNPSSDFAGSEWWNATTPTATTFSVGNNAAVNQSGGITYVAYLFAHNAGGFGLTGTDNVISCGSYTGNGSATGPVVTLGYEPQWLLVKNTSASGGTWVLTDNMRGVATGGNDAILQPNTTSAEFSENDLSFTATGFSINNTFGYYNNSGDVYIYIAIRRGPMKVPTSGTSVFDADAYTGNSTARVITTGFPSDLNIMANRTSDGLRSSAWDRLRGYNKFLATSNASIDVTYADEAVYFDNNNGYGLSPSTSQGLVNFSGYGGYVGWSFRRAPSFFDEVCYTGTGSARTISHNLGVAPELMIVKARESAGGAARNWAVYASSLGAGTQAWLNTTDAAFASTTIWGNTSPTASVFSVSTNVNTNYLAVTYVAYLFATCPGVSKVGSYTGTAALLTVDCGFTSGARFVLIKRTDSTGDWYTYDSARGITSGNDPYLLLNSTAAEVTGTNYVDTDTTGFKVTAAAPAGLNASGGTYIFLAIA